DCRSDAAGCCCQTYARWTMTTSIAGSAAAAAQGRTVEARMEGYRSGVMRVRLICNAVATGVSGAVLDGVVAALGRAGDVEVVTTEHAGHATELSAEVAEGVVVGLG